MAEPTTPGEARKQSLRKTRWVVAGTAVGAAAFLTGIVAGVNGGDHAPVDGVSSPATAGSVRDDSRSSGGYRTYDDEFDRYGDDFGSGRVYVPQQQSQQPSWQPQTRSGGS